MLIESDSGRLKRWVGIVDARGNAGGDRRGEQSAALLVKRKGAGYDSTFDDLVNISVYDKIDKEVPDDIRRLYTEFKKTKR